jgi:hypothetical protein
MYIKPSLKNIRVLDFHRYKEILEGVRGEAERCRADLQRLLQSR